MEAIRVHTMAVGFVGERNFTHTNPKDTCPACGGIKSKGAKLCITCRDPVHLDESKVAERLDRHRRCEAALRTGKWTLMGILINQGPPTWEEIRRANGTDV